MLTQRLRAAVRNFIKQTNLDTYECLAQIYDLIEALEDPRDMVAIKGFALAMRNEVDARSEQLRQDGERILKWLEDTYTTQGHVPPPQRMQHAALWPAPASHEGFDLSALLGAGNPPIPYSEFAAQLAAADSAK